MQIKGKISNVLHNKVIWYMVTRYVTYFVQFIVSVIIAAKLGPYYLGIWGFVLLLINYFNIFNFGIPNSATVLMVQHKKEPSLALQIETSSMLLISLIGVIIACIGFYYALFGIPLFDKYELGNLFLFVCAIAVMQHFVSLFSLIARVRGSITEVAFSQTVIPMLTLLAVLSFKGQTLLLVLVLCYLIGNVLAILLFIWKKLIHFQGRPSRKVCSDIIKKGKYLFIYNVSFYLIFLSTKTIVSVYYPVEEFGFFTFAFTLSNAVLLMMQGFTAIVFPKLIDKFASKKYDDVSLVLHDVRDSYVTTSHAIMYIAFLFFPLLIYFMPKYQGTLDAIMLMGMTFLLYANSFGYSTLLIAQNAEKRLAVISIISLCLNVLVAFVLAVYVKCNYQYVIFATMLAYIFFTCSCVVVGKQIIHEKLKLNSVVADSFPVRLLVPYIIMISAVLMKCNIFVLLTAPLLLGIMNVKQINGIVLLLKRLLYNPNMVDVK